MFLDMKDLKEQDFYTYVFDKTTGDIRKDEVISEINKMMAL